jgi:hypothetical protein
VRRRIAYVVCCVILSIAPAYGQGTKHSPAPRNVASKNLTDNFAKSALRVLKMIQAETEEPSLAQNGGVLVPRTTNQAIDDLDVDAETKTDQAVVLCCTAFS